MSPSLAPAAKIAGFVAVLVLVFTGAWLVGDRVDPVWAAPAPEHSTSTPTTPSAPAHGHRDSGDHD